MDENVTCFEVCGVIRTCIRTKELRRGGQITILLQNKMRLAALKSLRTQKLFRRPNNFYLI